MGFKAGDTVFIVESNRFIREAEVRSCTGGIYLIQFKDNGVGDKAEGTQAVCFKRGSRGEHSKDKTKVQVVI